MVTFSLWDALAVIAKSAAYAATLGASGGVFFLSYSYRLLAPPACRRIRRLVQMLMAAAILASGVRIAVAADSMTGDFKGMFDGTLTLMIWQAGEGRAILVRAAGLLLATPAVLFDRRPSFVCVAGAAIAATSFAWIGHAQALASRDLAVALVGAHLLCVAFWLGALGPMLLVTQDGSSDSAAVASTVSRFGAAAVWVVGVLVAVGLALLWLMLQHAAELLHSSYGRYFSLKLGLVGTLVCFAALNKWRWTPRLRQDRTDARSNLQKSIRAEILLGALILIVTATFTTVTGPPALQ